MSNKGWFANNGQVIQTVIAAMALVLSAINVWPRLKDNDLFSIGAIVFYLLVLLVIVSVPMAVRAALAGHRQQLDNEAAKPDVLSGSATPSSLDELRPAVRRPVKITGSFYRVRISRYGLITENRADKQQWMMCGISATVSLSSSESVELREIRLATYGNKPTCRSFGPPTALQVCYIEKNGGHTFEVSPQMEYLYNGSPSLPPIEMILIDQFGAEHHIQLADNQTLPCLPDHSDT